MGLKSAKTQFARYEYERIVKDILYDTTTNSMYLLFEEDLLTIQMEEEFIAKLLDPLKSIQDSNATEDEILKAKQQTQTEVSKVLSPMSGGGTTSELTEIRRLSGKKFTYIRSDKRANHWRGFKLDADDRKRSKLRTDGKLDLEKVRKALTQSADPKVSYNMFKWDILNDEDMKDFTDWANTFSDDVKYQFGDDAYQKNPKRTFDASAGAQFLRFAAGASFDSSVEPLNGKIAINAKADSSFAIAEGKIDAKGYIPNIEGYELKFNMPTNRAATQHKEVNFGYIRAEFQTALTGFVGASALLDLGVGFDVGLDKRMKVMTAYTAAKTNKQEAKAKLAGDLFAGAKVGCEVMSQLDWKNPEKNDAFSMIAKSGYGADVAAGAGINGEFAVGYRSGKLYVKAEAGIVCGFGASGKIVFEVNAKTAYTLCQFVYHQLMKEDYSYIGFVEERAFELLSAYAVESLIKGVSNLNKNLEKLEVWWNKFEVGKAEAIQLAENILKNSHQMVQFTTPEAKGRMLHVLSETFWTSDEELQEKAILEILSWVQSKREANKVLASITSETNSKVSIQAGVKRLNKVLDGAEQRKYDRWYYSLYDKPSRVGMKVAQVTTMEFPVNLNPSYYA